MRRALVIGINEYPDAPLQGCVPDARRVADLLRSHWDGEPNFDIQTVLVGKGHAPFTKHDLEEAVASLFEQPADVALMYFSGHGGSTDLGGFLATPDDAGMAMSEILEIVNHSPVGEAIVLLDCCHAGLLGQYSDGASAALHLRDDACLLVASRGQESAMETSHGGVFTQLVCDAMEGGGADPLGRVTAASMYAYVDQSLSAWHQRPLFKANLSRFQVLRKVEPMVPPSIIRLLPTYFPTPDYEFPLDPSFEPTQEPQNEQNERTFKDFQKLRDAHLLVPVGEEHLYYAAVNGRACKLTSRGRFYWRLAKERRV